MWRDPDAPGPAAADEVAALGAAVAVLRDAGHVIEAVSAGSTPTALISAAGEVNEIRPGTYLLGDRQQLVLGAVPPDGLALVVAATVVSTAVPGQVDTTRDAATGTVDRTDDPPADPGERGGAAPTGRSARYGRHRTREDRRP